MAVEYELSPTISKEQAEAILKQIGDQSFFNVSSNARLWEGMHANADYDPYKGVIRHNNYLTNEQIKEYLDSIPEVVSRFNVP